jgi:hypothetical protein
MIEWIQLNEVELLALHMYETYVHEDTHDIIRLDGFIDVGSISVYEVTQSFNPHVYWYRSDLTEDIEASIDLDKRLHELSPTNNWWEVVDEDLETLYQDDEIYLSGICLHLTEFKLAINEYGEDIFVADTPEWRFFFFRSNWKMLVEDDY